MSSRIRKSKRPTILVGVIPGRITEADNLGGCLPGVFKHYTTSRPCSGRTIPIPMVVFRPTPA